jgi:hypothetical protein
MANFAWDSSVNLSYHWYDAGGNVVVWDGLRTPLTGMGPGDLRSLSATVQPPAAPGIYTLKFDIVHEGVTWFSGKGMLLAPVAVNAQVPGYGALYGEPATASGAPGATISVPVQVTNVGVLQWPAGSSINLSYHLYSAAGAVVAWDGLRTPLPQVVGRDQTVLLNAQVKLPSVPSGYVIRWDLVQEGITWFSTQGVPMDATAVVVQ